MGPLFLGKGIEKERNDYKHRKESLEYHYVQVTEMQESRLAIGSLLLSCFTGACLHFGL